MGETLTVDRVADFSDADRAALRALTVAVYPPADTTNWWGRTLQWSTHDWCVRVRDDQGALISYVGMCLRDGARDGRPVRIGGIGGVKTHPSARSRGLAARGMGRAVQLFREHGVGFGLLVCEARLLAYYGTLGWGQFTGQLLTRQRGATVPFTFNCVMTCAVGDAAPADGTIDLQGPPW